MTRVHCDIDVTASDDSTCCHLSNVSLILFTGDVKEMRKKKGCES